MGKERKLFQNAKVVLSPSSRTLKIAVILLIVFSMIALGAMAWVRTSIRARTEDMRSEAAALEDENAAIEEKIDRLGTLAYLAYMQSTSHKMLGWMKLMLESRLQGEI